MIASGFVRRIDELGRIVVPKEVRDSLNIRSRDSIEIFMSEDGIFLRKYEPGDMFTGEKDDLVEYNGKWFSISTIAKLNEKAAQDQKAKQTEKSKKDGTGVLIR